MPTALYFRSARGRFRHSRSEFNELRYHFFQSASLDGFVIVYHILGIFCLKQPVRARTQQGTLLWRATLLALGSFSSFASVGARGHTSVGLLTRLVVTHHVFRHASFALSRVCLRPSRASFFFFRFFCSLILSLMHSPGRVGCSVLNRTARTKAVALVLRLLSDSLSFRVRLRPISPPVRRLVHLQLLASEAHRWHAVCSL